MASTSPDPKRKSSKTSSFLRRATLNPLTRIHNDRSPSRASDERPSSPGGSSRRSGLLSSIYPRSSTETGLSRSTNSRAGSTDEPANSPPPQRRPRVLTKGSRPSSFLGTLSTVRTNQTDDTDTPPLTASSGRAPSFTWSSWGVGSSDLADIGRNRTVLHYGEVQTNSGLFRKKKEFLVLTETHLVRFKNRSKASETFHSIPTTEGRMGFSRHASMPSSSSAPDEHSLASEASGEKIAGIPLEHIVAVYPSEETRNGSALEIACLDGDTGHASFLTLQFSDAEDKDLWSKSIRAIANEARLADMDPIARKLAEYAARVVEKELDYDVEDFFLYKVVRRAASKSASRTNSDDYVKASSSSSLCFLVIGLEKVHLISLPKNLRSSSVASMPELNEGGSFGIMTLTSIILGSTDTTFQMSFRMPFQKTRVFHLASLASFEIARGIRAKEQYARPGWLSRPYLFEAPAAYGDDNHRYAVGGDEVFDRTLISYCHAYNVNASVVRYGVSYTAEDSPRFDLFEPSYSPSRSYGTYELLAILRALRFNETFVTISFAGISLDGLRGVFDPYGFEHACTKSHYGTPVRLSTQEQQNASLLVQEIRALAVCSKSLRRFDFSHCLAALQTNSAGLTMSPYQGSGIVEALYPLCKAQATNVDWIVLSGITLGEADLAYLVGMGAEKACHFRALEVAQCGLTDRSLTLLLDAFKTHDLTMEVLDISDNTLRLVPSIFTRQLSAFSIIRRLDLSNLAITASAEPLIPLETLLTWRLEHLRMRGIALNSQSIEAICEYLKNSQSATLRELDLSNCSLGGDSVALVLNSTVQEAGSMREMHLDISENRVVDNHSRMTMAIARGFAPTQLSLRSVEYDQENKYQELLVAISSNKTIKSLSLAKVSLPGNANYATSLALERLFSTNLVLEELDISGEDSRLEVTKFGTGLNRALAGLKLNTSLKVLRVQFQRLGLPGASALAEMLKENTTLRELHCDQNSITLTGFTDLVNALAGNRTLLFLPTLQEGREAALQQTQQQIKAARTRADGTLMTTNASSRNSMRNRLSLFGAGSLGPSNSTKSMASKVAAVPQWTEQDVQAALRIVSEGWEAQALRLQQYLQRNWRIFEGVEPDETEPATDDSLDNRETPRPGTGGSIAKALERAMLDSTPTLEKQAQFTNGLFIDHELLSERAMLEPVSTPRIEAQALSHSSSPQTRAGGQTDGADDHAFSITSSKSLQSDSSRALPLDSIGIDRSPFLEKDDLFAVTGLHPASSLSLGVPRASYSPVSGDRLSPALDTSSSARVSSDSGAVQQQWLRGLNAHAQESMHSFNLTPPIRSRKQ